MLVEIPNWLVNTRRIASVNCREIYKETLSKKLGAPELIENLHDLKKELKKHNIKSHSEYLEKRKPCWPIAPNQFYKDWRGWDDFFDRDPRPSFEELKIKLRTLKIKTRKKYTEYRKQNKLNWPVSPERFYKEEWIDKYDFYGTLPPLSFKECQKEVQINKIKNSIDYLARRKSNWPSEPEKTYEKYWKGWDHFLGVKRWLNFEECRKEIRKCKIKNRTEYREKKKPKWPYRPEKVYKKYWKGWNYFLGTKDKVWPSFEKCRKEIKKYKIKGILDYRARRKPNWPSEPEKIYKKYWKDWYHYLSFYPFLNFEQCRKELKKYKIKNSDEYKRKRRSNWPSNPNVYYKEWKGYDHFLGK